MAFALRSLRSRLTAAVMVPLIALVATFGGITCWMVYVSHSTTSDRILIGSVRLLSRAVDADDSIREELFPMAVHLLQRRSAPVTYYSVYDGSRLITGVAGLRPPADYAPNDVLANRRHPAARFPRTSREPTLVRGYVDPQDADGVIQPAYLRDGTLDGKPVRIATEIRVLHRHRHPIVIQVADFIQDRQRDEQIYFLRVFSAGLLILMIALLLFYGAITWGLRPFASLTGQIEAARRAPALHFRLMLEENAPKEAWLLTRAFNELMARTERAITSLRQFTANASHQMRTPLAIIRVHLDVLNRYGANSPRGHDALSDIGDAVASLERLLLQLIALARTEEQIIEPDASFDLAELAGSAIADRITQITASHIDICLEKATERPVMARGHPALASEMIGNLIDNAVHYNRTGGSVAVRVIALGDIARIEIEDDGPGIAPADRERVWERFYRASGSDATTGSGLGLPIVRALAERMSARVWLEEAGSGHGVLAIIEFPAGSAAPAAAIAGHSAARDSLLTE